jgi:hypothetical protein
MAFTITQARPLLTAAELELFDQSRTAPIKALTLARLRGKVTRTRTLRDKYRDLFRRQTVSVRKAPATAGRSPVGSDNERTQRKAEILQEVLGRFEDRVALLESNLARDASAAATRKAAAPQATTATRKAGVRRAGGGAAPVARKSATAKVSGMRKASGARAATRQKA